MTSFKKAIEVVGTASVGYQCDPRDQGSYIGGVLIGTNWGISAPTLASYLGKTPTREEMMNLSRETALVILENAYWIGNNLNQLKNQSVATLLYDGLVNHGINSMRFLVTRALKRMNKHLDYYHVFTHQGIKLLNRLSQKSLFHNLKDASEYKYQSQGKKDFKNIWRKRLDQIRYYSNQSLAQIMPYTGLLGVFIGIVLITGS